MQFLRNSGSPAVSDEIGSIQFIGKDDGGNDTTYGQIKCSIQDETGGTEDGWLQFGASFAGTLQPNMMTIRGDVPAVVINEGSGDIDFRVESNANVNMFKVDGGLNLVGVGAAPVNPGAQFQVDSDASFLRAVNTTQHASAHDVTVQEAHGFVLVGKATSGTCNFNLPDAVAGMHLRIVNIGSGINVVTASGDSLNGVTNSGTTATLAASITGSGTALDLVCIADNTWIANSLTAPAAT
jgi:hypothetical protein